MFSPRWLSCLVFLAVLGLPWPAWPKRPGQVVRLLRMARSALRQGRFGVAARTYEKLFRIRPSVAEHLCLAELAARRYRAADRLLGPWCRKHPDEAWCWHCVGTARLAQGEYAGAARAFHREVSRQPGTPGAWLGLGRSLAGLGRRAEAATALSRYLALEERPRARPWRKRAKQLLDALVAGREIPRRLLWGGAGIASDQTTGPRSPARPARMPAEGHSSGNRSRGGGARARELMELRSALRAAEARGDQRAVLASADRFLSRAPSQAFGYLAKARALLGLGQPAEAVRVLRLGLRRVPSFGRGIVLLAETLADMGHREEAIAALRIAAAQGPMSSALARRAAAVADRLGLAGLAGRLRSGAQKDRRSETSGFRRTRLPKSRRK